MCGGEGECGVDCSDKRNRLWTSRKTWTELIRTDIIYILCPLSAGIASLINSLRAGRPPWSLPDGLTMGLDPIRYLLGELPRIETCSKLFLSIASIRDFT